MNLNYFFQLCLVLFFGWISSLSAGDDAIKGYQSAHYFKTHPKLCDALLLKSEIESSKKVLSTQMLYSAQMTTDRPLANYNGYGQPGYTVILSSTHFLNTISAMNFKSHWVDFGAGKAYAQIDFLLGNGLFHLGHGRVTAVDLFKPTDEKLDRILKLKKYRQRFEYKVGEALELAPQFKNVDVITDIVGPMSYIGNAATLSSPIDELLESYAKMLKVGGRIYLGLSWTEIELENKIFEQPTFFDKNGKNGNFLDWVKKCEGLELLNPNVLFWNRQNKMMVLELKRNEMPLKIPRLRLLRFLNGMPPKRVYEMEGEF